ncbi:hypothetical protein Esi_0207_0025 [Ectocarpus siliculosus]|uniref:C-type lectin domain-containing protein n=1 Tax=Ectocarpus siliculosus TaxID=2880 RepID=D7FQQ9_ECTSI|nr:hypothetical protein Esi_0207_0025 [Ectocarpus siliculosus]|eukprot:CBJ49166.1 hypothetical protein Esi_0207_0025 [Ectocarpus siliculosus]
MQEPHQRKYICPGPIWIVHPPRYVIPADEGHFKLSITRDGAGYNTSCLFYGASATAVAAALDALDPIDDLGGSTVVREGDGASPEYNYGFVYHIVASNSSENLVNSVDIDVVGSGVQHGCARLSTLGYWEDELNWDTGVVPSSTDEVTIPTDAGFVVLTADTAIDTLRVNGGALVTHDSTCLPGWTPAPGGTSSSFGSKKCYRFFDHASSWAAAQSACASAVSQLQPGPARGGSLRGALVTVQGLEENNWVARMCRGDSLERDCWVGMTRSYRGAGRIETGDDLEWAELENVAGESRYRSWATREPSDFENDEAGEHCVATQGSRKRAADQGEARWYDDECEAEKPFVCQAFGISTPFSLSVSTELEMAGGYIVGAGTVTSSTLAQVSGDNGEVGILNGATVLNSGSMDWSAAEACGWGGSLHNTGTLTFSGTILLEAAEDGEGFLADNAGAWPAVVNEEGGEVVFEAGSEVDLEWLLWNEGGSVVVEGELDSTGGGYSSSGTWTVEVGGEARFSDSSLIMHQSEVVVVTLQADREVTGQDVETFAGRAGYYRLAFGGEETSCIGYHASEETVEEALEEMSSIDEEGGVTVRRDGDGKLERWQYGYRYVVTFDGTRALSGGSNTLALSCAGSADDCGCVDISGGIEGTGGSRVGCGAAIFDSSDDRASTSAEFDSSTCRVQGTVELETLKEGGETVVSGGGVLAFANGGQYFLPSAVTADVEVMSGAEVVCPHSAAELVGAVNVSSGGVLWFAGAGWEALDAVSLLHSDPDTPGRSGSAVASPPGFNATIDGDVNVQGDAEVRLAAATPAATVVVLGSLTLAGGGLSGRGRISVEGSTLVVASAGDEEDDASSLRNGLTLDMYGGGEWSGGGLKARDGVTVVNRGLLEASAAGGIWFGKGGDFGARAPLDFDGEQWYENPLCGDGCTVEPSCENRDGGEILGVEGSNVVLGFVLHNEGTVRVEDHGRLEWCGEGQGGGNGTVDLPGMNSTLVFSAGGFVFGGSSSVAGEGVLEFSAGTGHELPKGGQEVSPLVKVSGHGVVTFAGTYLLLGRGVTVADKGVLVFSSVTSSTLISGEATLMDDGLIIFPLPSVLASLVDAGGGSVDAEAPWGSGEGDQDGGAGWGAASRSSVTVEGTFVWMGGAISGNARVVCAGGSEWTDGNGGGGSSAFQATTKHILNSLHLVSRGDVVWSTGDVIVSTGAAFVNQGTLLLLEETEDDDGDDLPSRIRASQKGERPGWRDGFSSGTLEAMLDGGGSADAVATGGAGSAGGGAANWAWEELSYYDASSF